MYVLYIFQISDRTGNYCRRGCLFARAGTLAGFPFRERLAFPRNPEANESRESEPFLPPSARPALSTASKLPSAVADLHCRPLASYRRRVRREVAGKEGNALFLLSLTFAGFRPYVLGFDFRPCRVRDDRRLRLRRGRC